MKDINNDHPIMKRANLKFLKKKIVLLSCSSNEVNGVWIITPPFYKLPKVLNGTLVAAIKDVLEHSQWKIPFEDEYLPHLAMKEAIGVTHGKLHTSGTKSITISQENNEINPLAELICKCSVKLLGIFCG